LGGGEVGEEEEEEEEEEANMLVSRRGAMRWLRGPSLRAAAALRDRKIAPVLLWSVKEDGEGEKDVTTTTWTTRRRTRTTTRCSDSASITTSERSLACDDDDDAADALSLAFCCAFGGARLICEAKQNTQGQHYHFLRLRVVGRVWAALAQTWVDLT